MTYGLKVMLGIAALGLGGCTMENPAFVTQTGEASTGSASTGHESDPSESSTATTDTLDTTDTVDTTDTSVETTDTCVDTTDTCVDTSESANTTDSANTTETGGDECMLEGDQGLAFKMVADIGLPECGEMFGGNYRVSGANNGNMLVQPCEAGCEACNDVPPYEFEIYPEDLTDFATNLTNACVHIQLTGFVAGSETYCGYDKAVVTLVEGSLVEYPIFVGSSGDGLVPTVGQTYLDDVGLSWELVEAITCECPEDDPCCLPEDVPTLWDFDVGDGPPLQPGDIYEIDTINGFWDFIPMQAQYLDSCGAKFEVSWMFINAG